MTTLGVSRVRLVRCLEDDPELRKYWRGRLRDKYLDSTLAKLIAAKNFEVFISRDMFVRKYAYDLKWLKQHFRNVHEEILRGLLARRRARAILFYSELIAAFARYPFHEKVRYSINLPFMEFTSKFGTLLSSPELYCPYQQILKPPSLTSTARWSTPWTTLLSLSI